MSNELRIDEIGYWSEIKLAILEKYAKPYNQILLKHKLRPIYIDGFAGAGHHIARGTTRIVDGSPVRALKVEPPFESFHFVDSDKSRVEQLAKLSTGRANVRVYHGDCNDVLVNQVFPQVNYTKRQRALCILDPYGLQLDWETIRIAGQSRVIEIFLNFPVMDMNRNVFWRDYEGVHPSHLERMVRFWGDDSWKSAAYQTTKGLFGDMEERTSNEAVSEAFRKRLIEVAGFAQVPRPIPMRNSRGAIVYYLFFAAQNEIANKIVKDLFGDYGHRGEATNG
jgi:three-Cys-motif partner protein